MDITVLANHITLNHFAVEDVSIAINIVLSGQHLEVAVVTSHRHVVIQHVLSRQMHHRRYCVVKNCQNRAAAACLETREVLVVGRHLLNREWGYCIRKTHVCGMFHQLALEHVSRIVLHVGQRTNEDGVVDHGREQQLCFLRMSQLFITAHSKLVVSPCKESCKGFIIGREDRLTTSFTQHFGVT